MESLEDIEKALSKLVPSALSERGQQSIEDMIDGLAAGEMAEITEAQASSAIIAPKRRFGTWSAGIGAAAAAVAISLSLPHSGPVAGEGRLTASAEVPMTTHSEPEDGLVLLGQVERLEAAEPEDWVSEADGVSHRAWRFHVVDEERVQDVKTGYEVTVSCPREKVVLMPATAF